MNQHPTKGELDSALDNYYTKGETYDRGYIDAKFDDRYTKGEVDDILDELDEKYVHSPYTPLIDSAPPTKGAGPDGTIQVGELHYNTNDLALYIYAKECRERSWLVADCY